MPVISIKNLSFSHRAAAAPLFDNLSLNLDASWRLGLVGRNGKGKTTLLRLLLGELEYEGKIESALRFAYFPRPIQNPQLNAYKLFDLENEPYERWRLEIEAEQLGLSTERLAQPFVNLSKGEQTKAQLALLFVREDEFMLIDEPTNHLDADARRQVAQYLCSKSGFILVSHDRDFLDECIDHVLVLNRSKITLEAGNYSSWFENKRKRDDFERAENEKLKKQIAKLDRQAKQKADWANRVEASKYHPTERGFFDRGYIGARSAKMMKGAVIAQRNKLQAIDEKTSLLKDVEEIKDLHLTPLKNRRGHLIDVMDLSLSFGDKQILHGVNFAVEDGDRVRLKGRNGCGKTTLLRLLLGEPLEYSGKLIVPSDLKISYLPQDTSGVRGSLPDFIAQNGLDSKSFLALLRRLDFEHATFGNRLEDMSEGQKKKLLIAKSLSQSANIYIWDEPLNYIDIFSRQQIERLLREYHPTLIFVEHDEHFAESIATKVVKL